MGPLKCITMNETCMLENYCVLGCDVLGFIDVLCNKV